MNFNTEDAPLGSYAAAASRGNGVVNPNPIAANAPRVPIPGIGLYTPVPEPVVARVSREDYPNFDFGNNC
jgi:hypothetical protein